MKIDDDKDAGRAPLSRRLIIETAVTFADTNGLEVLSMRKLGAELGVEAMSLYNHVENKEDILNGMVDYVFQSISLPPVDLEWKEALRQLATSLMDRFTTHAWTLSLKSSHTDMGPGMLIFLERLLAILGDAGFSDEDAHHALQMLGSHASGYAFQQASSLEGPETEALDLESMLANLGDEFPNVARMAPLLAECDFNTEYAFGLDIIIDGLAARLDASRAG